MGEWLLPENIVRYALILQMLMHMLNFPTLSKFIEFKLTTFAGFSPYFLYLLIHPLL